MITNSNNLQVAFVQAAFLLRRRPSGTCAMAAHPWNAMSFWYTQKWLAFDWLQCAGRDLSLYRRGNRDVPGQWHVICISLHFAFDRGAPFTSVFCRVLGNGVHCCIRLLIRTPSLWLLYLYGSWSAFVPRNIFATGKSYLLCWWLIMLFRKLIQLSAHDWAWSEDSYLVDPASSHMLVSKIKPCMSKYKHFILWNCEWLIKSVIVYLMISSYLDTRGNSRANTCDHTRLLEGWYLLDKKPSASACFGDS